jgi:hypothetical protein
MHIYASIIHLGTDESGELPSNNVVRFFGQSSQSRISPMYGTCHSGDWLHFPQLGVDCSRAVDFDDIQPCAMATLESVERME